MKCSNSPACAASGCDDCERSYGPQAIDGEPTDIDTSAAVDLPILHGVIIDDVVDPCCDPNRRHRHAMCPACRERFVFTQMKRIVRR